jgi:TonB family protein
MRRFPLARAIAIGFALAGRGFCQDVIVGDPVWSGNEPKPEVMPQFVQRPTPQFPDEMRNTDEINYAIVHIQSDPGGKVLETHSAATSSFFGKGDDLNQDLWLKAARRGGQPIGAEFWFPEIFNPAAAGKTSRNSSPRLLSVTQVLVPPKLLLHTTGHAIVQVRLEVSSEGRVTGTTVDPAADPAVVQPIQDACARWSFAPARKEGQPVAARVHLAVVVEARPDGYMVAGKITPPKIVRQVPPEYPPALRRNHVTGTVVVAFEVDESGTVRHPVVESSTNRGFEEAAILAVRQWKFQPALKAGQPVSMELKVPLEFNSPDFGWRDGSEVTGSSEKMPPGFRYDTPPHTLLNALPVYPYELLRDNVTGSAQVGFVIGDTGRVIRTLVIKASRPEFGLALAAAVSKYEFEPALLNGKPTQAILNVVQPFSRGLPVIYPEWHDTDADRALIERLKAHPDQLIDPAKVEPKPDPHNQVSPVFPVNLRGRIAHGAATIELLVDEHGVVRVPRVVSATDPEFGYAAAQAVVYWRFDPPTVNGRAVVTHVLVPFEFGAQ